MAQDARQGARQNASRWRLTDLQKITILLLVVVSCFLAAMSLGMQEIIVFLIAVLLLVTAGLTVFLLGLRHNTAPVRGSAQVIDASPPPPADNIIGKCELTLLVQLPDRPAVTMKVREPTVSVIKWPVPGMKLPIEVPPESPRKVRILWERVPSIRLGEGAAISPPAPYPDYTDVLLTQDPYEDYLIEDTPRRNTRRTSEPEIINGAIVGETDVEETDAEETDADGRKDAGKSDAATGEERTNRLPIRAKSYNWPWQGVPQPRDPANGGEVAERPGADPGLDVVTYVSDLAASLRFYADDLGLRVIESGTEAAVLSHGAVRIVLRHQADMAPIDRRLMHIHIRVPDINEAFNRLKEKGIPYARQPTMTSRTDAHEVWTAVFHDPDGHGVGLIEWRDRVGPPT